jgi:signal transduction histidine kinase
MLLARMVSNVVDNAITHNAAGGWVRIRTEVAGGSARLVVENGGPVLDERAVQALTQPFRRLGPERTGSDRGSGLGLSIVSAIAEMHGGRLELHALAEGGFQVVIELPVAVRAEAGVPA